MRRSGDPAIDGLPENARALLAQALGFALTAQCTSTAMRVGHAPDLTPAVLVNVGFAYELSFKAFLAAHGWSDRDLRAIGHDLVRAMRDAEGANLVSTDDVSRHLALISPQFRDHSLRYLSFGTMELPLDPITVLFEHMDRVSRRLLDVPEPGRSVP